MNHYPHHIGDFNNATRHLTRVERSLYRDMIELYYDTEQALNADTTKIARRILATSDEERTSMLLVLEEFFVLQDDGWHNTRCDDEIAKYQGQIQQASRAGKASAAKRSNKTATPSEQAFNERSTPVAPALNQPEPEPEPSLVAKATSSPAELPTCPHETLIDLFSENLPTLPQPKKELWVGKNAEAMRTRWRWVLSAKKKSGDRYATNRDEAIAWFGRFFAHVAKSEFLSGTNGKWTGCDLGWLMKADNFAKVVSGNYDNKEAA